MPLYRIRLSSSQKPALGVERACEAKDLYDAVRIARARLDYASSLAVPWASYDTWHVLDRDPVTAKFVPVVSGPARQP